jgi:hypothetical protein
MGDRRCCCVKGCLIGDDNFNRDDAETLGPKWMDAIEGTWHIVSEEAVEQTGTGRILFAKRHPVPAPSMAVYLDATDPQDGDIYELLVNADEDGDNYHLARFTIDGSTVTIGLYRVTGSGETLLEEEDTVGWTEEPFRMQAIISRTQFCASMTTATLSQVWYAMPSLFNNGYYAGMGVDGRAEIAVDNWEFFQHLETFEGCPFCICHCENYPIAPKLLATIVDATNRLADFEGCEIELSWDRILLNWQQDPAARCDCGASSNDLGLILTCDSTYFTLEDIGLQVSKTCHDSAKLSSHVFNPLVPPSTCDPFFLRFGPVVVAAGDLTCCYDPMNLNPSEYYIEITELP